MPKEQKDEVIQHETWVWDNASQTVCDAGVLWDQEVWTWDRFVAMVRRMIDAGEAKIVRHEHTVTVPDDMDGMELTDIFPGELVTNEEGLGGGYVTVRAGDRIDVWTVVR
jgi:hypothetical protein